MPQQKLYFQFRFVQFSRKATEEINRCLTQSHTCSHKNDIESSHIEIVFFQADRICGVNAFR